MLVEFRQIQCKRCSYTWYTQSRKDRICCAKCKTSIIHPIILDTAQVPATINPRQQTEGTVYLPLALAERLNKVLLPRLIGIAHSESASSIPLKVNKDGEIYL